MLTVGELFAGIGGFGLGFERAGMRTLWQVEQSEFCRRVLERHFPGARRYEDVRHVGAGELAHVDLICGGFPCQDLSYAGKGAGIDGERSGLWSEYARIVGELRPRYVVVENVPALLGRGLGRVLGDLAALGYDAEWDCLPASAFGAPHRRDRIWLVAYPEGVRRGARRQGRSPASGPGQPEPVGALQVADADRGRLEERRERDGGASGPGLEAPRRHDAGGRGAAVADAPSVGRQRPGRARNGRPGLADGGGWPAEPAVGRVVDGFPGRVDRLAALGNALVPQIAEWIGRRIIEWEEGEVAA